MDITRSSSEVKRLERLWSGEFGDAYVDRNRGAGDRRSSFWQRMVADLRPQNVLEVGCNRGANLHWLASYLTPPKVYGLDINKKSLQELHHLLPKVNALRAAAQELPFGDNCFDLVFTIGVLIHQPESSLPLVMSEIVRCSRRYILCGEYFAEQATEIAYRGQKGALFKRDYGRIYQESFQLRKRSQGFLGRDEGWDDVTYWVFEKI